MVPLGQIFVRVTTRVERLVQKRRELMARLKIRKDITAHSIAVELGVADSTVSRVIAGEVDSAHIQERLAQLWGVSVDSVFPRAR